MAWGLALLSRLRGPLRSASRRGLPAWPGAATSRQSPAGSSILPGLAVAPPTEPETVCGVSRGEVAVSFGSCGRGGQAWAPLRQGHTAAGPLPGHVGSPALPGARAMSELPCSCNFNLAGDAPPQVVVEYAEGDPQALDLFIAVADAIEEEFPSVVVVGNPEDSTPREGAFEVVFGDSTIFSRLQMSRLPDSGEVVAAFKEQYAQAAAQ